VIRVLLDDGGEREPLLVEVQAALDFDAALEAALFPG
jgi:hypothetical protein